MARSECTLKTASGKDPVTLIANIRKGLTITEGDRLHAGNLVKSRILDRTARGVDVNNRPFEPYSTKGPFYYYPYGHLSVSAKSSLSTKQRADSARRLQRKIGGTLTKSRIGIKFASYAAFKQAIGRSGVDLRGLHGPHMLQAIQIQVNGETVTVGIYGDEAKRASGHNEGIPHRLPRRYFFGSNTEDHRVILADLKDRALKRAEAAQ